MLTVRSPTLIANQSSTVFGAVSLATAARWQAPTKNATHKAKAKETRFAFFTECVGNRPRIITQLPSAVASSLTYPPLLYADTERSADALYFGRVDVPDPFIAFGLRGRKYAVVSSLEFGRVRKESDFDTVLPLEKWIARARARWPRRKAGPAEVIRLLAGELKQTRFTVGEDFPAGTYAKLRQLVLDVVVAEGPLFPAREIKTRAEIAALREGNR